MENQVTMNIVCKVFSNIAMLHGDWFRLWSLE